MTPRHPDTPTCRGVSGDVGAPKQTGQVFGSCESLSGRAPGRPVRRRAGRGGAPGGAGQGLRGASSTVVPGPVQHGDLPPAPGPTWAGRHPTCRGDTPTYVGVSGCRGMSGNPPTSPDMTPRHVGVSGCRVSGPTLAAIRSGRVGFLAMARTERFRLGARRAVHETVPPRRALLGNGHAGSLR